MVYKEVVVCSKICIAVHGITKRKTEFLQKNLKLTGQSPKENRGGKNYRMLSYAIVKHTRQSHYSLHDNRHRVYLPEDLNIKEMFEMYKLIHPDDKISYQNTQDLTLATRRPCAKLSALNSDGKNQDSDLRALKLDKELHLQKVQAFYVRKKSERIRAKKCDNVETIAMDYQKNVSLPNITTNDVYYRRQLSVYTFHIHVLSNGKSYFYTYPEFTAKKGSDEVASFLFDFIVNHLARSGQNENYTIVRFVHYVVHVVKVLKSITVTFSVRGHSYLECDKKMCVIDTKQRMEVPADWKESIAIAKTKSMSFKVISVEQSMVVKLSNLLNEKFVKKCPFAMQKMKEIATSDNHPRLILHRETCCNSHFPYSKIIAVHGAQRKRCTSVERLAHRGDAALGVRVSVALIASRFPASFPHCNHLSNNMLCSRAPIPVGLCNRTCHTSLNTVLGRRTPFKSTYYSTSSQFRTSTRYCNSVSRIITLVYGNPSLPLSDRPNLIMRIVQQPAYVNRYQPSPPQLLSNPPRRFFNTHSLWGRGRGAARELAFRTGQAGFDSLRVASRISALGELYRTMTLVGGFPRPCIPAPVRFPARFAPHRLSRARCSVPPKSLH
ncbi:hypothetical protein PR048_006897 [Dryococelus australis]|uniref:Uncharacterized protein n=1 Tax=Dryococelus australis TaxID=614101 RepID=A0ABQ9IC89_9NEOP|nr:hypothetical protein PR048_006897 [Dryococelus australis]